MKKNAPLKPDPEYLRAFSEIMSRIGRSVTQAQAGKPIVVCVAGGAAMHFYTGARFSDDIDAKVFARILLDPADLQVAYRGGDGHARLLYLDMQYNDTYGLLHSSAYDDALPITLEGVDERRIEVRLLTPLDLAVSKLARFSEQDQDDIRELGRLRLVHAAALRHRAESALPDYVGHVDKVKNSIELACGLVSSSRLR
jgi:hypothetical protein